jgi:hypothetical protein
MGNVVAFSHAASERRAVVNLYTPAVVASWMLARLRRTWEQGFVIADKGIIPDPSSFQQCHHQCPCRRHYREALAARIVADTANGETVRQLCQLFLTD